MPNKITLFPPRSQPANLSECRGEICARAHFLFISDAHSPLPATVFPPRAAVSNVLPTPPAASTPHKNRDGAAPQPHSPANFAANAPMRLRRFAPPQTRPRRICDKSDFFAFNPLLKD
ncbi:MAG: hypothetical protein DBX55_07930 [Verrucomicrobia bacterium]|nr:MAG: hypothetical protein DBX55_07930 [Verrucomicrobiota bacterium]